MRTTERSACERTVASDGTAFWLKQDAASTRELEVPRALPLSTSAMVGMTGIMVGDLVARMRRHASPCTWASGRSRSHGNQRSHQSR